MNKATAVALVKIVGVMLAIYFSILILAFHSDWS